MPKTRAGVADELRGRVKTILKKVRTPRKNITKEECMAIGELKMDNNRLILTADKGVALVVMDKEDYSKKQRNYWTNQLIEPSPMTPPPSIKISWSTY